MEGPFSHNCSHYLNLDKMESRDYHPLTSFRFGPISEQIDSPRFSPRANSLFRPSPAEIAQDVA